jgi:hypothetical protein
VQFLSDPFFRREWCQENNKWQLIFDLLLPATKRVYFRGRKAIAIMKEVYLKKSSNFCLHEVAQKVPNFAGKAN